MTVQQQSKTSIYAKKGAITHARATVGMRWRGGSEEAKRDWVEQRGCLWEYGSEGCVCASRPVDGEKVWGGEVATALTEARESENGPKDVKKDVGAEGEGARNEARSCCMLSGLLCVGFTFPVVL